MLTEKHLPRIGIQLVPLSFFITGCSLSPSIPLFGAAFPAWLFCAAGGVLLTGLVHILVIRQGWQSYLSPLIISYLGSTLIFSVAIWFLFF